MMEGGRNGTNLLCGVQYRTGQTEVLLVGDIGGAGSILNTGHTSSRIDRRDTVRCRSRRSIHKETQIARNGPV